MAIAIVMHSGHELYYHAVVGVIAGSLFNAKRYSNSTKLATSLCAL